MADLEHFRSDTREWLSANCPDEMRKPMSEKNICWGGRRWVFESDDQKIWLERMAARGWTVPTWPKEYGGAGLSRAEADILKQEMRALGCRSPLNSFGISMLGPALLHFGNDKLKEEHLGPIARGEIRWCQGYSEPGAGSDLASLQTKAEDKGDHYLVNGQKVWTSYGDRADKIFVLTRTDTEAPKHLGISFMLADMDQPGIEARPIKLISGASDFCETFFDDARVEKDQIVGELNRGWDVAKYLLTHEREFIGEAFKSGGKHKMSDRALEVLPHDNGKLADAQLRDDIARLEIDELAFDSSMKRIFANAKAGVSMGAYSSVLKYLATEINKRNTELAVEIEGLDGASWNVAGANEAGVGARWLRSKGNSIEGGTSEVQLNIVAKALLELPTK